MINLINRIAEIQESDKKWAEPLHNIEYLFEMKAHVRLEHEIRARL